MSQFTNRHGKKVNVNDDEVIVNPSTRLPIAQQNPTTNVSKQPKVKRQLLSIRLTKRASVTLFVMIVVVAVAMLVTADSVKRDYESQTSAMKRSILDRGKQSTSTETAPEKTIKDLRASLNARADCKVHSIDVVSWYGPAKVARQDCQTTADRYKKLQLALDDMSVMAQYTSKMTEILKGPLAAPTSGEYATISEYAESWQKASSSLGSLQAPEILAPQHQNLVVKVKAVSAAWDTLSAANGAKNTDDFKKAETALNDRYSELRTVSDSMQTIIMSTQTSINRYIADLSA
jgi:hypothetical protein